MGVLWCVVVFGALALGRLAFGFPLVCVVFSAAAAIAAIQIIDAWEATGPGPTRVVAGVGAASVGASSMFGARALGAAILVFVAVTLLVGVAEATRRRPMLATTALLLQAALPVGLVAASVQLVTRYEIGAVVILLAIAMGFDLGDYLIGSGAGSLIEGPMAGGLVVVLVVAVAAIIKAPPFDGSLVWAFGVAALVLCPLGQVAASWLLPDAKTRAGALRRLDSLLVLAPAWAIAAGIVSAHS
jgi:hypothetical protein